MARNRLIKMEFWRDEKIGSLSHSARLLFISLWTYADDSGNGRADARLLRSQAFPYDANVTAESVEAWLQEIAGLGMIVLYEAGGTRLYSVKNFLRHQVINRPSKFRLPEPPKPAAGPPEQLSESSLSSKEGFTDESKRERERKRVQKRSAKALSPQPDFENLKIKDPRFQPIVEAYFDEFRRHFGDVKPDFDGSDAKSLISLLKRRQEAATTLITWLVDAFKSDDVPPLRPRFRVREFCSHAVKFANGPIRKGGSSRARPRNLEDVDSAKLDEVVQ
jgi:hypothetical protein